MTVDVIIPTFTKTDLHKRTTLQCLRSLYDSDGVTKWNVLIYEQNRTTSYNADKDRLKVQTIHYDFPFNYNRVMNAGIAATKNRYILLCNNDLRFNPGFWEELHEGFKAGYLSLSPACPLTHTKLLKQNEDRFIEGWTVREQISGWCIAIDRRLMKKIGKLNEEVEFWYSDNIYSYQLQRAGVPHALCTLSLVVHLNHGSATLKSLPKHKQQELMNGQFPKFHKAVNNAEGD